MKTMILAAGRGERMRPLTDRIPKPLIPVVGRPLIVHLIHRLVREGFADLIINTAYLAASLETALGDGQKFGARIRYSRESPHALDTGGGIRHALPLLGPDPFLVLNGDLWTDYPFSRLLEKPSKLAHLVLVPNPPHNPVGDFFLLPETGKQGCVSNREGERLTFSGVGVYRPALFHGSEPGISPLRPILDRAIDAGQVTGERYLGVWRDIGTLERLREITFGVGAIKQVGET
uniref:MurNAc alpha-1-phosphate uridylyltransferase n=1 Tax=Candidatus Kentrum sp. DK TaxID=2126562 RepID=A0A450SGZ2_9GAMM|nr:MAG: MurNAc alpha-1-phosphate uridylyltransferase [Candidatus Kentron sp. DK]VFJ54693.1 MAG: MurNAc alpha-1-phosphate uridylyltransferase [Candidatus Kentron sp. DK]